MDPMRFTSASSTPRFPRPRGDGPSEGTFTLTAPEVSPPTRGWTARVDQRDRPDLGFPAHAGMDPSS